MLTGMVNRVSATARVQDANSAAFWAYHSARLTFFIGQVGRAGREHIMGAHLLLACWCLVFRAHAWYGTLRYGNLLKHHSQL